MAVQQNSKSGLLETLIPLEPTSVGYNIEAAKIQEFVESYFNKKLGENNSFMGARCTPTNNGERAEITAFFDLSRGNDIIVNGKDLGIHPDILKRMGGNSINISDQFRNIIAPISYENITMREAPDGNRRIGYIELNIFRVIGLMLSATPKLHDINITNIYGSANGLILTVIKSFKINYGGKRRGGDVLDKLSESISRSRR